MVPDTVSTEDGSITCRDPLTGELYHNRAGAYTEALKNYVEPSRLAHLLQGAQELNVLDVCFGLGYNVYVLLNVLLEVFEQHADLPKIPIRIIAIDKDPEILAVLPEVLSDVRFEKLINQIGPEGKNKLCQFGQHSFQLRERIQVSFELVCGDIRQYVFELENNARQFDLIYHDGFSPRVMPELWTYDLFAQYTKLLSPKGAILTYSSAAAVRSALRMCGLDVMRTSAVGGKSGGTIAACKGSLITRKILTDEIIFTLRDDEEARLQTRSSIPYRDPELKESRENIVKARNLELEKSSLPRTKTNLL
jgi:tRNA U34 5-methylaminomethyl-2-thiouridine-forming methyltransferase MnmC